MNKSLTSFLAALLLLMAAFFPGCTVEAQKGEKSPYEATELKNVSMQLTDITPTGAVLTITDTNESPFVYGEWFTLEKKEGREWFGLHPLIENYSFFDLGYRPNQNGKVIFEMDWEKLYGKLPKGSYRVLKKAGLQYIAVGFTIG